MFFILVCGVKGVPKYGTYAQLRNTYILSIQLCAVRNWKIILIYSIHTTYPKMWSSIFLIVHCIFCRIYFIGYILWGIMCADVCNICTIAKHLYPINTIICCKKLEVHINLFYSYHPPKKMWSSVFLIIHFCMIFYFRFDNGHTISILDEHQF